MRLTPPARCGLHLQLRELSRLFLHGLYRLLVRASQDMHLHPCLRLRSDVMFLLFAREGSAVSDQKPNAASGLPCQRDAFLLALD